MSTVRFFSVSWADSKLVTLRAGMPTALNAEMTPDRMVSICGAEWPLPQRQLTCGQDSRENPALAKAHRQLGEVVLLQDRHAAGPHVRCGAVAVVSGPVPHQHAIVRSAHLTQDRAGLASVLSPDPGVCSGRV